MSRLRDPARVARDRLLRLERQAKARAEAAAVAQGVDETVALSRARGAAIAQPTDARRPHRRQTGLEWLAGKGRIGAAAHAAGQRYGAVYRRAKADPSIRSTLDVKAGRGQPAIAPLAEMLAHGEGTQAALRKLAELRARLCRQPDLVAACDLICGEEKTPREAVASERDAGRIEAVLKVALDILAAG